VQPIDLTPSAQGKVRDIYDLGKALLIVATKEELLIVSGTGEVIDPDDGIAAIGSGGMYALAAAKALKANTDLLAVEVAEKALRIAGDICVFTNGNITVEEV